LKDLITEKETNLIKDVKIFLLELNPANGLSSILREILESSLNFEIQFLKGTLNVWGDHLCGRKLTSNISTFNPDIIFLVLSHMHHGQFSTFIQSINTKFSKLPIIIVTEEDKPDYMIDILKLGVVDFITPPLKAIDVLPRVWRLLEYKSRDNALMHGLKERIGLKQLVGKSPAFLAEIEKIPHIAKCSSNVLISGETGTGKEMCARAIHYLSPRNDKPFVPVNCGTIPKELMENELFGHVKGAFTGASNSIPGIIREADGGSLFLDEIDCLTLSAQVKLLRFLQEKEYRQLGSTKIHKADVRVIAATNIELEKAVKEKKFRNDLFYRLNIIPLVMPPLRKRKEDISLLAGHFLEKYATEFNKRVTTFTSDAMQKLIFYEWPGNVRELENIIERAVVFSKQTVIQNIDIALPRSETAEPDKSFQKAKSEAVSQFEKNYIRSLLFAHHGNITRAAKVAQKNRRAFWELIRKHKIEVQDFKSSHL
jgi:two-component system response regulator GlrR